VSDYEDKVFLWHFRNTVIYLKETSERYAPNVKGMGAQLDKVGEELEELVSAFHANYFGWSKEDLDADTAKECADVIIAAARLGTMLSPDFAQVILDRCKELNEREPLK